MSKTSGSVYVSAFSPDGQLVATAPAGTKIIRVWNAATAACLCTLVGHTDLVNGIAFSPDSQLVASASSDGTVRLWDPVTGWCLHRLEGHFGAANAVTFSPNNRLIASASNDKTVRLWSVATGSCYGLLEGHSDSVHAVAFSSDSKRVASTSLKGIVWSWDVPIGSGLNTLEEHLSLVRAEAFEQDGQSVGSTFREKTSENSAIKESSKSRSNDMNTIETSVDGHAVVDYGECYDESSVGSLPQSSIFDRDDDRSRGAASSTVATSQARTKTCMPLAPIVDESTELEAENLVPSTGQEETTPRDGSNIEADIEKKSLRDDSDAETVYSTDSAPDDPKLPYIRAFSRRLAQDVRVILGDSSFSNINSSSLDRLLRAFAWNLYGESSNPFQWETSVVIHQMREDIIDLLSSDLVEVPHGTSHEMSAGELSSLDESDTDDEDQLSERQPFQMPQDILSKWVDDIQSSPVGPDEPALFQLPDYEKFIQKSDAYQWLLFKLCQNSRLTFGEPNLMLDIGARIRYQLRTQESLRRLSRRRPPALVRMTFHLEWNPADFVQGQAQGLSSPPFDILEKTLCLTGSWNEAQATTLKEYISQTWPVTGEPIMSLLKELMSFPVGRICTYRLPNRKNTQISAQVAEQIGWLASALRSPPKTQGVVACSPRIEDLKVKTADEGDTTAVVEGSGHLIFNFQEAETYPPVHGFCWGPLFRNLILIRGYPILRRPETSLGLEMSLHTMAYLLQSRQIVKWGERLIMKGFSSLLVATLVTTNVIVWHLLENAKSGDRISYIDPRLDELDIRTPKDFPLRALERCRHVVGWCANATDFCGHSSANRNVLASGLRKAPPSIVIDRLYIEAGSEVVGGLNMCINKKEQPFWLQRESDYPSLLKWVGLQPIVFYDVSECRAWLIDGISALLHLVRVSLFLDENDPESPYDWVFDATKFKDTWDGCTGRLAALKTLKSGENRNLRVYIKEISSSGETSTPTYAILEERVKKILHSIEILIDRQVKVASQDGIKITQTLNPRRKIIGFDILDVISPLGPVDARVKHLDSGGHGWVDLIRSIGVTTIFGNGFGDLIRPDDPEKVCEHWRSVPGGTDYMAATVSTLKLLYEKRLLRVEPCLGIGEITSKILWTSPCQPFKVCECLGGNLSDGDCHLDPVQFLVSKSWRQKVMSRGSAPINLRNLPDEGAVVFGQLSLLGRRKDSKASEIVEQDEEAERASSAGGRSNSQELVSPSMVGSLATPSTRSTGITVPSLGSLGEEESPENGSPKSPGGSRWKAKRKKWKDAIKLTRI